MFLSADNRVQRSIARQIGPTALWRAVDDRDSNEDQHHCSLAHEARRIAREKGGKAQRCRWTLRYLRQSKLGHTRLGEVATLNVERHDLGVACNRIRQLAAVHITRPGIRSDRSQCDALGRCGCNGAGGVDMCRLRAGSVVGMRWDGAPTCL